MLIKTIYIWAEGLESMELFLEKKKFLSDHKKIFLIILLSILMLMCFLLPYIQIIVNKNNFCVTSLDILMDSKLNIMDVSSRATVSFPNIMRIAVFLSVLSPFVGVLFISLKKRIFAAESFIVGAITPIISLITVSDLKKQIIDLNISSNRIYIGFIWPFFLILILGVACAILSVWLKGGEKLAEAVFFCFASISVGLVFLITLYMVISGLPAIIEVGIFNFLFGSEWDPSCDKYGIFYLILASFLGTFGAVIIGVPVGVLTAVFLSEIASKKVAFFARSIVELLAGIPSVIYGFFGMMIIVPFIRNVFAGFRTLNQKPVVGDSLLAVILVLAIMVLPTIISISETSIRAIPKSYKEASLGLGATHIQTIFKVTLPAARSGILSGIVLGVGRAIGETMAVIMVAGNIVNFPELLGSVRLLTTGIAIDMAYSSGLFRQSLFGIGLVLFVFIMIVNISFMKISKRGVQTDATNR